jgi:hypothetical protein
MKFTKHFDLILRLGQQFEYGWVFGGRNILKTKSFEESIVDVGIPETEQGINNDKEFEEFILRTLRSIDYMIDSPIRFAGYKQKLEDIGKNKKKKYLVQCIVDPSKQN